MYVSLFSCLFREEKTIYIWKDIEAKCLFNSLYLKPSNLVVVGVDCFKSFLFFLS